MNTSIVIILLVIVLWVYASTGMAAEMRAIKIRIPDNADAKWIENALDRIDKAHFNTVVLDRENILERDTLRDWVKWVREGLVDVISTQNYSSDDETVEKQMKQDVSYLPKGTLFWSVISIKEVDTGCRQLESVGKLTKLGVAYFVYSWLTDERIESLARGPFKEKVSPPERQNLLLRRPKTK